MTKQLSSDRIDEIVDCISQERDGDIPLTELLGLTKVMIESLQSMIEERDGELGGEVSAIADHIERTQIELDALKPGSLAGETISGADDDLKEVVGATEQATQTILESAERIMAAGASDTDSYRRIVDEAVINIFEACCFQDITGQRINRVLATLSYISKHLTHVTGVLNGGDRQAADMEMPEKRSLLNGPQSADTAISQDAAKDLFGTPDSNVVPLKS